MCDLVAIPRVSDLLALPVRGLLVTPRVGDKLAIPPVDDQLDRDSASR